MQGQTTGWTPHSIPVTSHHPHLIVSHSGVLAEKVPDNHLSIGWFIVPLTMCRSRLNSKEYDIDLLTQLTHPEKGGGGGGGGGGGMGVRG